MASQSTALGDFLSVLSDVCDTLEKRFGPLLDVGIRLWLAQGFFVSGVLKIGNWDTALFLAANEYPVWWLDPAVAAVVGVVIEIGASLLLAAGLATRAAAVAMLALALVIQFNYRALDIHLLWAALLAWTALRGPGALSVDRLLKRGSGDTAVPFATGFVRLYEWLSGRVFPLFNMSLRIWLGVALVIGSGAGSIDRMAGGEISHWLPVTSAPHLPVAIAALFAAMLVLGLGTRIAGIALASVALLLVAMDPAAGADWRFALLIGLLATDGAGALSLDALLRDALCRRFPQMAGLPAFSLQGLPRVVIVGAGFGGLECARALRKSRVQVTLIDRHNYHLFQPLLYQVATAGLSPGDIATPVRGVFREQFNATTLLGTVTAVDTDNRRVVLAGNLDVPYDYLVLATGASHSYFGRDEWAPHAPGLKRVEDATDVRRRLLTAFERAEACIDEAERRSLLTFLIVGGGPTGVELAGAIAELARFGMDKDFRRFDPATARVVLVQAGPRILPAFPPLLSLHATQALEKLGVEVLVDSRVELIDAEGVTVNGTRIASRTVLWAAGVVSSPAAKWIGAPADTAGRVKVADDLSVPGMPGVFAVGDTAASTAWDGQPVPGLAPAAKQGGAYVAMVIRNRIAGRGAPPPFRYRHLGSLATIGRKAAVADFGRVRISGTLAWWLWGLVHVGFLVGVRNRVSVMFDWFWAYLTLRSGTRLITGAGDPAATPVAAAQRPLKAAAM